MSIEPGLIILHSNRAEDLRELLVSWLHAKPLEPLEPETIIVQSNGVAQWLRLALAQNPAGGGIAAAKQFVLPASFVWQAYRAVLGADIPAQSPLDRDALAWRLLRLLPELAGQPRFGALAGFLADDPAGTKLYQLAVRLADVFDQYQVYRADWLADWGAGVDCLADARGLRAQMPAEQLWQADLWRAVLADIGDPGLGRAALHESFMERLAGLRALPAGVQLARRIVVFGISAMPRQLLQAITQLAPWVQVLVCVNNPCEHYWGDIQSEQSQLRAHFRRQRVRDGAGAELQATNPLLASWGRQGRDFMAMLDEFDDPQPRARWQAAFAAMQHRIDAFQELPGENLLQQLQDDIRDLRPLEESRAKWPAVDPHKDASMRFSVAYSELRELEVLHDQILAAMAADPSLRPSDIMVMVPDIQAYAASIQAVFGLYQREDYRHIPYLIADQVQRKHDPLLLLIEQLLNLPRQRLGLSEVLAWLDVPACRARFGIEPEEIPALSAWVEAANIRWGLNAQQRASFGLQQSPAAAHAHTWVFGLERMLLGYASGAGAPGWQGIEPLDLPGGLQAATLGRLACLLNALQRHWQVLGRAASPQQWLNNIQALLDDFFLPQSVADEHKIGQLQQAMQDWLQLCNDAQLQQELAPAVVIGHLMAQIDQGGLSQRFFAGAVCFARLMPMRAIPFRRIYLLGMQDGAFPREQQQPDFDLLARYARLGDRSRREDDRYLFLEALLSAREHFGVSWVGRSIQDDSNCPPSVLVAQLREHLDRGWQLAGEGVSVAQALTTNHPLHPYSKLYFGASSEYFTYASQWRSAHQAPPARAARPARAALASAEPELELGLAQLRDFLRAPVNFFYAAFGVRVPNYELIDDALEPFNPAGLPAWSLRGALLDAVQRAAPDADLPQLFAVAQEVLQRAQRAGALVAGNSGQVAIDRLLQDLGAEAPGEDARATGGLLQRYLQLCAQFPLADEAALRLAQDLDLADGQILRVRDSLSGWRRDQAGQYLRLLLSPSALVENPRARGAKRFRVAILLAPWLEHVAAHAAGRSHSSCVLAHVGEFHFAPLAQDAAQALWQDWWRLCLRARQEALPLELETAWHWLRHGDEHDKMAEIYAQQLEKNILLQRNYPDLDALLASGEFFDLARAVYGSLEQQLTAQPAEGG